MKRDENTYSLWAFWIDFQNDTIKKRKKKKKMRKAVKRNIYFLTRRHEEPDERAVCLEEEDVGSWTSETPEQDASGMCQSCA